MRCSKPLGSCSQARLWRKTRMVFMPMPSAQPSSRSMVAVSKVSGCHISSWLMEVEGRKLAPTGQTWWAYHALAWSSVHREFCVRSGTSEVNSKQHTKTIFSFHKPVFDNIGFAITGHFLSSFRPIARVATNSGCGCVVEKIHALSANSGWKTAPARSSDFLVEVEGDERASLTRIKQLPVNGSARLLAYRKAGLSWSISEIFF